MRSHAQLYASMWHAVRDDGRHSCRPVVRVTATGSNDHGAAHARQALLRSGSRPAREDLCFRRWRAAELHAAVGKVPAATKIAQVTSLAFHASVKRAGGAHLNPYSTYACRQ